LKKQTQFPKGRNERIVNYNKRIREIYWIGHLVKTKPIKANFERDAYATLHTALFSLEIVLLRGGDYDNSLLWSFLSAFVRARCQILFEFSKKM